MILVSRDIDKETVTAMHMGHAKTFGEALKSADEILGYESDIVIIPVGVGSNSEMNIVVCIKQVPGTTSVDIDPETGALKRDGVASKMNPYDLYALETALRLKEQHGGEIAVITMGASSGGSCHKRSVHDGCRQRVYIELTGVLQALMCLPRRIHWHRV